MENLLISACLLGVQCRYDGGSKPVISYFVTGSSFITLPVEIYNYVKKPIQPKIYALFTLMFLAILILMSVMNLLQAKSDKNRVKTRRARA